jgi:hypothetical protein
MIPVSSRPIAALIRSASLIRFTFTFTFTFNRVSSPGPAGGGGNDDVDDDDDDGEDDNEDDDDEEDKEDGADDGDAASSRSSPFPATFCFLEGGTNAASFSTPAPPASFASAAQRNKTRSAASSSPTPAIIKGCDDLFFSVCRREAKREWKKLLLHVLVVLLV